MGWGVLKNCWPADLRKKTVLFGVEGIKGRCHNHDVVLTKELSGILYFRCWGKWGLCFLVILTPNLA